MVTIGGLACGGQSPRPSGSGGTGGGSGGGSGGSGSGGSGNGSGGEASGGASSGGASSGGASSGGVSGGGSGGSSSSSGGGGSGGSSNGGSGGGAGGSVTGGAGGTTAATSCTDNGDCSGDAPLCETTLKLCVPCLKNSDCASGGHCLGNACVTLTACRNTRDYCNSDQVCDPSRGLCFECVSSTDCGSDEDCVNNTCVHVPPCQSDNDCGTQVCDTNKKQCVECLSDGDCAADTQHCIQSTCQTACSTDKVCTPLGMLCDTATTSTCVLCKTHSDCPASSYCEAGMCKPDICDSTQSMCTSDGVAACNANGSGWDTATACDSANPCKAFGGFASCGGTGQPDAAIPLSDGASPVDGGAQIDGGSSDTPIQSGCSTATAVPCTAIPPFTGTQTVDGNGDDMCQVPSFTFTKAGAAKVNNYNNIPDSQFESITARVAWAADGFHAFFDVTDASVQTVDMVDPNQSIAKAYQGDSIEIYITSNNTLTGLTSADGSSLQVIVPATGPAISVKTDSNGSGTPTTLLATQYKQAKTSGGYAIEVLLPWPGSAPSAGAQIRFDLAFNSADKTFGTVDDMRDAQVIYYLGTVTDKSTCQGDSAPYCDDRTWCGTTLQ